MSPLANSPVHKILRLPLVVGSARQELIQLAVSKIRYSRRDHKLATHDELCVDPLVLGPAPWELAGDNIRKFAHDGQDLVLHHVMFFAVKQQDGEFLLVRLDSLNENRRQ